jgi:hypothetical protein
VLPAKHVLYLIDACSAGLGVLGKQAATSRRNDAQAQAELLSILSGTGSRWLVTAGFGSEKAYVTRVGNQDGYSVFTRAFLDSIKNANSPTGFVTLDDVMAGIRLRVGEFVRANPALKMTPTIWPLDGNKGGSFLFVGRRATLGVLPSGLAKFLDVIGKSPEATVLASLLISTDVSASVVINGVSVGTVRAGRPRVFSVATGENLVQVGPSTGAPVTRTIAVESGQQRVLDLKFAPPPEVTIDVQMQKGGRVIRGREKQTIGQGYDGVVQSLALSIPREVPGLTLKRQFFYMDDTGRSDGGGPVMRTMTSPEADAREPFAFPKGLRGVKFWLDGANKDQYSVSYQLQLTNHTPESKLDGQPGGDWTPSESSSQHQLLWLSVSISRKPASPKSGPSGTKSSAVKK